MNPFDKDFADNHIKDLEQAARLLYFMNLLFHRLPRDNEGVCLWDWTIATYTDSGYECILKKQGTGKEYRGRAISSPCYAIEEAFSKIPEREFKKKKSKST